ncbi:MAG: hypothetical protein EBZ48_12005 [Proteobacteria bacterium]|nr:hypothetical protein [Pseudomonadota bacterium]
METLRQSSPAASPLHAALPPAAYSLQCQAQLSQGPSKVIRADMFFSLYPKVQSAVTTTTRTQVMMATQFCRWRKDYKIAPLLFAHHSGSAPTPEIRRVRSPQIAG